MRVKAEYFMLFPDSRGTTFSTSFQFPPKHEKHHFLEKDRFIKERNKSEITELNTTKPK
jgi:hypothetical protein